MAAMLLLVQNRGEMTLTPTTVNTAGKQITTLTGIRRKLLIGKAG